MQKQLKKFPLAEVIIISLLFLSANGLIFFNFFEPLEVKTIDARMPWIDNPEIFEDIVLITIDDDDLEDLGEWPWPRSTHAKLVDKLAEENAKVIGFDVFFTMRSSDTTEDTLLVEACRKAGNVISALPFDETTSLLQEEGISSFSSEDGNFTTEVKSPDMFSELSKVLAGQGIVDLNYKLLNPDGIIRAVNITDILPQGPVNSLGLEIARHFMNLQNSTVEVSANFVSIPNRKIPLYSYYEYKSDQNKFLKRSPIYIRYTGPPSDRFESISYTSVLRGDYPKNLFQGKIALVGASAASLYDIKRTPFNSVAGVYINALIARSVLKGDFLHRHSRSLTLLILFCIALLTLMYLIQLKPSWLDILTILIITVFWWYLSILLIIKYQSLIEIVAPVTFVVTAILLTRFWQMFIRLHLTNIQLTQSNEKLDSRVHELETLYDLSNTMQSVSDMKKINRVFLTKSMDVTGSSIGFFLHYEDLEEKLTIEESLMPDNVDKEKFSELMLNLARKNLKQKNLIIKQKVANPEETYFQDYDLSSLIIAPLRTKREELIGQLILIRSHTEQAYSVDDERVIHLLSAQATSMIENTRLYLMAVIDGLTQLYVRRYFDARLNHEVKRVKRYGGELSLLMMDIDHFKNFNDTYGHQTGDDVLKVTAKIVAQDLRDVDLAARYGGEEICVLLPETGKQGAMFVAERIRKRIDENRMVGPEGESLHVTMSIGVSTYADFIEIPEDMLKCADTALYFSKEHGRNKTTFYEENMQ